MILKSYDKNLIKLSEKSKLSFRYLRFPLHSDSADKNHDQDGYYADQSDIIDSTVDDLQSITFQEIVERITETYCIHGSGHCVGESENHSNGRSKFRPKRTRYYVINTT